MKNRDGYNQKAWYRLLKVFFVTAFFIVYGFLVLLLTEDAKWRELDVDDTVITCSENWKNSEGPTVKFSAGDLPLEIKDYHFEDGAFEYKDYFQGAISEYNYDGNASNLEAIFNECFVRTGDPLDSIPDVLMLQRMYELKVEGYSHDDAKAKLVEEATGITDNSEFFNKLAFSGEVFSVEPNYKYFTFIWPLLIAFLCCTFVWEFVRRVFYYVAFGSMLFDDYAPIYRRLRNLSKKLLIPKS